MHLGMGVAAQHEDDEPVLMGDDGSASTAVSSGTVRQE
jgi:hypothetical protein